MRTDNFGWWAIVRLGLVQMSLGAIVVLTTSTLNRVMVVELALPALLPGLLVGIHYAMQGLRPRMGFGSDVGGRRTPWIIGGMAVLALGGVGAAMATAWMTSAPLPGIAAAVLAFMCIGVGVSACGTTLLVLLAKRVTESRRAAAATIVWLMMIVGFALTAGIAGRLLDPFSPERLVMVTVAVAAVAMMVTVVALSGLEGAPGKTAPGKTAPGGAVAVGSSGLGAGTASASCASAGLIQAQQASVPEPGTDAQMARPRFREALAQVWSEPAARRFTVFVFVSMLAYSAQDLILEPFAGAVFGYTPGQSTQLAGVQHGGAFAGMLLGALAGSRWAGRQLGSLRAWTIGGCLSSALALLGLVAGGLLGGDWPLKANVFLLGLTNGAFAIAAIASMMRLAGRGHPSREGVRMGLWGAAQAIAFGIGGLAGAAASDLARWLIASVGTAYASVFAVEAMLFIVAAAMAARIERGEAGEFRIDPEPSRSPAMAGVADLRVASMERG